MTTSSDTQKANEVNDSNKKTMLLVVILLVAGLVMAIALANAGDKEVGYEEEVQPVACTMDAKVCPDGSAVGRVGPDCEFAPCPDEKQGSTLPGADLPVACTMDVQECPDGTFVGRVGPNCDFEECPGY